MKKAILLTSVTAILLTTNIITSQATDIASGNSCGGSSQNCKWRITDSGILIVERENTSATAYTNGAPTTPPSWSQWMDQINTVVFDGVDTNNEYFMGDFLRGNLSGYGQTSTPTVVLNNANINMTPPNSMWAFEIPSSSITTCPTESDVSSCLVAKGISHDCGNGKYYQEKDCVFSCGASFRLNDGECDRIRYTPAEAAQYLKDTDNTIIMTFKVNR